MRGHISSWMVMKFTARVLNLTASPALQFLKESTSHFIFQLLVVVDIPTSQLLFWSVPCVFLCSCVCPSVSYVHVFKTSKQKATQTYMHKLTEVKKPPIHPLISDAILKKRRLQQKLTTVYHVLMQKKMLLIVPVEKTKQKTNIFIFWQTVTQIWFYKKSFFPFSKQYKNQNVAKKIFSAHILFQQYFCWFFGPFL